MSDERPRLKLAPRTVAAPVGGPVHSAGKSNPFGDARPRELVLGAKGVDATKIDLERIARDEAARLPRFSEDQRKQYDELMEEIEQIQTEMAHAADGSEEAKKLQGDLAGKKQARQEFIAKVKAEEASAKATGPTRERFERPSERRARLAERDGGSGGQDRGHGRYDGDRDRDEGAFGASGAFGNRRGGGGGGGGGRTCYNCGEAGHMSRECTEPRRDGGGRRGDSSGGFGGSDRGSGGGGGFDNPAFGSRRRGGGGGERSDDRSCYRCGQSGHISRDCPEGGDGGYGGGGGGGGGGSCYTCGESGHFARECPSGGGGDGGRY